MLQQTLFVTLSLITVFSIFFGYISAGVALIIGIIISNSLSHPWIDLSRKLSGHLLKTSIVLMGFGLNIDLVWTTARSTFLITSASIALSLIAGVILFKSLKIHRETGWLISSGTAICGGSAIAAVSQTIRSKPERTAMALTIVFLLNMIGLFLFPLIGQHLLMSQEAFGLWAALAIHDTSSVVGAAATYGEQALEIATTTKLARALWIIPLVFVFTISQKEKGKFSFPIFILFFIAASITVTFLPQLNFIFAPLSVLGKYLIVVSLFLLGLSVTKQSIKELSFKPALMGVVLWFTLATSSYFLVQYQLG